MSLLNIAQLQANVGNLVAPNGFLSTSRNRETAVKYARKQGILGQDDNFRNVLLEIEIGTDVSPSCIFADVAQVSAFPDEREILFSIGAIFRVNEVVPSSSETDPYIVKMKAANNKEYGLIDNLLSAARKKFEECDEQKLILQLLHFAQSSSHHHFNFDRLWTWIDIKNGMYATSQRAIKALVSGAYKFTRTNHSYNNTGKEMLENTEVNKDEPGFCFYSGSPALHMQLKAAVDDDKSWISSGKLNRILASTDFQDFPRTYFVVSETPLPTHLKTLGSKWLHIYYSEDNNDFDELRNQVCHDLAQYYRQTAQRILREQNDQLTAKSFLIKSTRLYEQLEKDSEERLKCFSQMLSSSLHKN